MDPFRLILKSRVREGQLDALQNHIPAYIERVKATEPHALQFEAFTNADKGEVIWLESYTDPAGFDAHLNNEALTALKSRMKPLQQPGGTMYLTAAPSDEALERLRGGGTQVVVLDPWAGTLRLDEGRDNGTNIQSFVKLELSDVEAYREISERVEAAAAKQPGVIFHRSYQIDDSRVAVLEEYADSEALMTWAGVFGEKAGDFGSLVKSMEYHVCGTPTAACKALLDGWGAVYYPKVAGYRREMA